MSAKTPGPRKKIVRVAEEYDMTSIGEEMAKEWSVQDDEQRKTLKQLRDHFNRQVLRRAMIDAGMDIYPGEIEASYKYLFDDTEPESMKKDVEIRLDDNGVDIDQIVNDFINSPQTILNYLHEVEGVELQRNDDSKTSSEKSLNHIQSLNKRYENVVEKILDRLIRQDKLPSSNYSIEINCIVTDENKNESRHIEELL